LHGGGKKMKRIVCLIFAFVIAFSLFSCSFTDDSVRNDKIKIVATLFPQYDFARTVAGDRAQVELLLPLGTDSHSFDPSMKDAAKLSDADIFIYTGEVMENWALPFAENAPDSCIILDVSKNIEPICLDDEHDLDNESEAHNHSHSVNVDPHIWTSPENAAIIVNDILESLCFIDPENSDYYIQNATEYTEKLLQLDADFAECVENARLDTLYFGGKFAFRYFAQHYGIKCVTLYDSCSESSEPDPATVTSMVKAIKDDKVKVVLYPELSDDRSAESIAEGTGAHTALFHSCHNLSKNEFESGKTYLSIMYENLEVLREALS